MQEPLPPVDRIVIVEPAITQSSPAAFVIDAMAEEWRAGGLRVDEVEQLNEPTGPNVLVFPHFDMTAIPEGQREILVRCARVINRNIHTIAKRAISRYLVASPYDYDGPVIVKTNLNFGGLPEIRDIVKAGGRALDMLRKLKRQPWPVSGYLYSYDYKLFDHPSLVPPPVWSNPRLVVERFLPERDGELYGIRQSIFLGNKEINTRVWSPRPLVKSRNAVRREILDGTPPAIKAIRERFGFDYGKFDYVAHGDDIFVFDVSRTPSYDPESKAGSVEGAIRELAAGIEPFLGRA